MSLFKKITACLLVSWISLVSAAEPGLPEKIFLPAPFLCQAPDADWRQPWQDACEDAAIIMALHYFSGQPLDQAIGRGEILDLVRFQQARYGGHFDLTVKMTGQLLVDRYGFHRFRLVYDLPAAAGIALIKQELARGNLVIAPMAGRQLGNPFFTPPGPAYHYLLFKGYDERTGEFITNDPGTKRGKSWRYKYRIAYDAIHDWTGDKYSIGRGRKALLIISSPEIYDDVQSE